MKQTGSLVSGGREWWKGGAGLTNGQPEPALPPLTIPPSGRSRGQDREADRRVAIAAEQQRGMDGDGDLPGCRHPSQRGR